jgi:hypothetical protein
MWQESTKTALTRVKFKRLADHSSVDFCQMIEKELLWDTNPITARVACESGSEMTLSSGMALVEKDWPEDLRWCLGTHN